MSPEEQAEAIGALAYNKVKDEIIREKAARNIKY